MNQSHIRGVRAITILVLVAMADVSVVADNVTPRAASPSEDAAMMKVAALVRHTDYDKTAEFIRENADWPRMATLKTKLAFALFKKNDYAACKTLCQDVITAHRRSDPLSAAWAQDYLAKCLVREKSYTEAVDLCLQVLSAAEKPDDLTPVLAIQRGLGWMMQRKRVAESAVASRAARYAAPTTLVLMARCAYKAEQGDIVGANTDVQELARSLQPNDVRIALAGTGLVMTACYIHGRDPKANAALLPPCEAVITQIEQACPNQQWLIARAKLSLGCALMSGLTSSAKAEAYFREVTDKGTVTDLLPEAHSLLANVLYDQQRYVEAATAARTVVETYPYSTWVDFAAFLQAESVCKSGDTGQAISLWDAVISQYPESGWVNAAKLMKKGVTSDE